MLNISGLDILHFPLFSLFLLELNSITPQIYVSLVLKQECREALICCENGVFCVHTELHHPQDTACTSVERTALYLDPLSTAWSCTFVGEVLERKRKKHNICIVYDTVSVQISVSESTLQNAFH